MIEAITMQCDNRQRRSGSRGLINTVLAGVLALLIGCGGSDSSPSAGTGQAGSQARFAIAGNYLYTVNKKDMQIFDITTASHPVPWSNQSIGFGIETIFSKNQYLFIGSQTGIYIYDNSTPQFPAQVGTLLHARSCDPVVVEGDYAYVTLRSGTACSGTSNQLDIISITTPSHPILVKSYAMQKPSGLGVDNGKVFICDGIAGLKVLNVSDPLNITPLDQVDTQNCYDVIPASGRLVVSGSQGLYQYDYTAFPMTVLSRLWVFRYCLGADILKGVLMRDDKDMFSIFKKQTRTAALHHQGSVSLILLVVLFMIAGVLPIPRNCYAEEPLLPANSSMMEATQFVSVGALYMAGDYSQGVIIMGQLEQMIEERITLFARLGRIGYWPDRTYDGYGEGGRGEGFDLGLRWYPVLRKKKGFYVGAGWGRWRLVEYWNTDQASFAAAGRVRTRFDHIHFQAGWKIGVGRDNVYVNPMLQWGTFNEVGRNSSDTPYGSLGIALGTYW